MPRRLKTMRKVWLLLAISLFSREAIGQHYIEARGADTKYRYFDWNYSFSNSAIIDLFYVGVPGSNEFNFGGGYGLKPVPSLTVAPLVYAVRGKEGSQLGVKIAALVTFEKNGWKGSSFLAHFVPARGNVSRYQVLDTLDFSRTLARRWEVGISNGFFYADKRWNPQVGPMVKLRDRLGWWALSYRFGPQREFRLTRVIMGI